MLQYEVTFIVDPVLSGDEIKSTAKIYEDLIKEEGNQIISMDALGLKQLAYPIKKRTSGIYYSIEFTAENGTSIPKMELAFRRDERIMRFLTVKLDKYGVKYNEDKRNGLIGKAKKRSDKNSEDSNDKKSKDSDRNRKTLSKPAPKPTPKPEPKAAASEEE